MSGMYLFVNTDEYYGIKKHLTIICHDHLPLVYIKFEFVDPMKRATVEEIRKHEWFTKVQNAFK